MEEDEAEYEQMHKERRGGERKEEERERKTDQEERRSKKGGEKGLEARVDRSRTWLWVVMPCGDTGLWSQMHLGIRPPPHPSWGIIFL